MNTKEQAEFIIKDTQVLILAECTDYAKTLNEEQLTAFTSAVDSLLQYTLTNVLECSNTYEQYLAEKQRFKSKPLTMKTKQLLQALQEALLLAKLNGYTLSAQARIDKLLHEAITSLESSPNSKDEVESVLERLSS